MRYIRKNGLLLGCLLIFSFIHAKNESQPSHDKENPIDNQNLRRGTLSNGLSYYIKPTRDTDQLKVNLLISAGNYQEENDQFAMAHFMEHIALKAGKHISLKMRNESDLFTEAKIDPKAINAQTMFDYTNYNASLPNTSKALSAIFLFYSDILWDLQFKQEYIDSERSPFIDEHERKGSDTSTSYLNAIVESRLTGCSGEPPVNFNAYVWDIKREPLIRFYKKWYRPENAFLIITGNVKDVDVLEEKIKDRFSNEESKSLLPKPNDCQLNYQESKPKFLKQERKTLLQETKAKEVYWRLYMRQPKRKELSSWVGLQEKWMEDLMIRVLNKRLAMISEQYNTHYFARSSYRNFGALQISIGMPRGEYKRALQETIGALKFLEKNGITAKELAQVKEEQISVFKNIDIESTSYWTQELKNNAIFKEQLLNHKIDKQLSFLAHLSIKDFNKKFQNYFKTMPEDIALIASKKNPAFAINETTVRNWIRDAKPINHHKSNPNQKAIDFLATQLPDLELGYYQELITAIPKAKSYELLNGAQVILKSGKLAPSVYGDEHHLRMHAYAPQGARCFSSTDFHNAVNATQIIKNAGVGRLDKFELKEIKKREGAKISIHSYIRPYESGMYLNTSLKNLELAFQLIYLYFTQPNKDKIAFEDWKDGASYQYLTGINQDDFTNKMKESLEDPYYIPRGSQAITGIKETDFERAYLIYEVLFGDVSKFTFQFSGNFEEQKILNLCRKYLGNLPQNPIKISCPPVPKPPKTKPSIPLQQEFIANEKSEYIRLKLLYLTPLEEGYTDWKNEIKISIVYSLLGNILMKNLRMDSDKGGPYGIGVGNYHVNQPASYQEVAITFGARPEDEERLLTETKEVIDSLKTGSISKKIFQSVVNSLSSKQNNFTNMDVQHKMYNYYKYNAPWISMKKRREYINTLSYEEVVDFAQKILKEPPYIFKLLPQIEQ